MKEYGIRPVDIMISSPEYEHVDEVIEGSGLVNVSTTLVGREITCIYRAQAVDRLDFSLLRDEVFKIFRSDEFFYWTDKRNPEKRWLVKVADSFNIPQRGVFGTFEIQLLSYLGVAESRGTTLEPLTFTEEVWQTGQGLLLTEPEYVHTTKTFDIYNAGNVKVDPRKFPLRIAYRGKSKNLTITNNTTGETWAYTGTTATGETIEINGIRSLKQGQSVFKETNWKLISLDPGVNKFTLTGTEGAFLISFENKFYYL